jgi:hypothetical protein
MIFCVLEALPLREDHLTRPRLPTMANEAAIKWLAEPEDHDYPAAGSYLGLLYDESAAAKFVDQLRKAPMSTFKAKDIFRASGLSLMGVSDSHVEHDREKVAAGQSLSPLLLVRATNNEKVIIADGYHRMCAVYSFDEDALIPCKIV